MLNEAQRFCQFQSVINTMWTIFPSIKLLLINIPLQIYYLEMPHLVFAYI